MDTIPARWIIPSHYINWKITRLIKHGIWWHGASIDSDTSFKLFNHVTYAARFILNHHVTSNSLVADHVIKNIPLVFSHKESGNDMKPFGDHSLPKVTVCQSDLRKLFFFFCQTLIFGKCIWKYYRSQVGKYGQTSGLSDTNANLENRCKLTTTMT